MFWKILYLFNFIIFLEFSKSSIADLINGYRGAVVQYNPIPALPGNITALEINARNYETFMKIASQQNVSIIVFPEFGLTGMRNWKYSMKKFEISSLKPILLKDFYNILIRDYYKYNEKKLAEQYFLDYKQKALVLPEPEDEVILCSSKDPLMKPLKIVSCAARRYQMYVVMNHIEKAFEGDSRHNGTKLYSTNIVFNRQGMLVAKARKVNLQEHDQWLDKPPAYNLSVFRTDFGVSFAQFVGFDMFQEPNNDELISTLRELNIDNVVVCNYKDVENDNFNMFYKIANWTADADVNLLNSGFRSTGGAGIYVGQHGPSNHIHDYEANVLLVSNISKTRNNTNKYWTKPHQDYKIFVFTSHTRIQYLSSPNGLYLHLTSTNKGPFSYFPFTPDEGDIANPLTMHYLRSQIISLDEPYFNRRLCLIDFCCFFEAAIKVQPFNREKMNYYRYRIVLYEKPFFIDRAIYMIRNDIRGEYCFCAILACKGDSIADCNSRFDDESMVPAITFRSINIYSTKKSKSHHTALTYSANNQTLIPGVDYEIDEKKGPFSIVQITLKKPVDNPLIFGVKIRSPKRDMSIKRRPPFYTHLDPRPKYSNWYIFLAEFLIFFSFVLYGLCRCYRLEKKYAREREEQRIKAERLSRETAEINERLRQPVVTRTPRRVALQEPGPSRQEVLAEVHERPRITRRVTFTEPPASPPPPSVLETHM